MKGGTHKMKIPKMNKYNMLKINHDKAYKSLLTGYKVEIAYPHVITKCEMNASSTEQHQTFTDLQKAFEFRWEISPEYAEAHQNYIEYDAYRNSETECRTV